jgi:hypothetical protein
LLLFMLFVLVFDARSYDKNKGQCPTFFYILLNTDLRYKRASY